MSTLKLPFQIFTPIAIHQGLRSGEIVLIGRDLSGESIRVYTLSSSKKWVEWKINNLPNIKNVIVSAMDCANEILYIMHRSRTTQLLVINGQNFSFDRYPVCIGWIPQKRTKALVINGELNIFRDIGILIWNYASHTFIKQHHPHNLPLSNMTFIDANARRAVIYVPRVDKLFVFGHKTIYTMPGYNKRDLMYYRSLIGDKWKGKEISIPMNNAHFSVTEDGRYIVITSPSHFSSETAKIHILNTTTLIVQEIISELSLRARVSNSERYNDAVIARHTTLDKKMVIGFVRDLWKKAEFKKMRYPPYYLTNIIVRYYQNEVLYHLQTDKTIRCINMDDIIK